MVRADCIKSIYENGDLRSSSKKIIQKLYPFFVRDLRLITLGFSIIKFLGRLRNREVRHPRELTCYRTDDSFIGGFLSSVARPEQKYGMIRRGSSGNWIASSSLNSERIR
jgi:hypothetical protein